ncbi:carbohydrate-binding module family 12 protein [Irpex rosettiformis]|uniref:Carbohydrate-binding module family 12 protein n=1 Tax=Irpex rosettiformis TaxID=378272 RepID=A0ACB8UG01_9APHY|nr:carbohydrate-binding module family 12 protein [Irpex rosettiformis]
MVFQWEPETQYNLGDVVMYESHKYKIVQPHRSQADWTPPVTPALWARLPEEYGAPSEPQPGYQPPSYQQPQQPQAVPEKSWDEHSHQKVDIPPEEQKKNWWDLDEKRKKELEIGGGLALGAALLGGGLFAYNHHKKGEEEKKAQAWGLQNWLKDAQSRTQDFHQHGPRGPVTWVLVQGNNFPANPYPGGEEDGRTLYIARAFHEGSIQVGKTAGHWTNGAVIGYAHKEIAVPTFEVLLADPRAVQWVDAKGHFKPQDLNVRPVEAGREADGTPIYIAQAHLNNGVHPGKASPHLDGAFITYGGTEKEVDRYRVLVYV